jgi:aerobic-type carbon monoxide dehydrogenase small subunit (CoxS/CutS family)
MSCIIVNGKTCAISRPDEPLLAFLRSELGLTGAKGGCGERACGACTVLVDGQPTLACRALLRGRGEIQGTLVPASAGVRL